jgi:bifunctional pyridoxal-dependent enzyme with beta-cystathionase and maltose regulon repressor activities
VNTKKDTISKQYALYVRLKVQHDAYAEFVTNLLTKLRDEEEMAKAMWNSHPAYQLDENGTRYLSWEDVKDTSASQSAKNLARVVLSYLGLEPTS